MNYKNYTNPYTDSKFATVRKDVDVIEDPTPPQLPMTSFKRYKIKEYKLLKFNNRLELEEE